MTHPLGEDYKKAFFGRFSGVLRWPDFEKLWQAISEQDEGWYVYEPEAGEPPVDPLESTMLTDYLATTEDYLRDLCTRDFCGAVYADSLQDPTFIKIYNPRLMGGCGMGKAPLPQWIISKLKPVSLEEEVH